MKTILNDLSQLKALKEKMEAEDNRDYLQRREEMKFEDDTEDTRLSYDPFTFVLDYQHFNY